MAKATYTGPADRLRSYEGAVARVEGMERRGATMPYTSRNGHMTSFLDKDGSAAIRLSPEDRGEFLDLYDSRVAVQHGREMKEFLLVPDDLLDDTEALADWLWRGYDWVGRLKPKY